MTIEDAKKYLDAFYAEREAYIEGDDPATTFTSCGAVMLASAVLESFSPDEIASTITLPINFVAAVIVKMELVGLWGTPEWCELVQTLRQNAADFADVEDALHSLNERLWYRDEVPGLFGLLDRFRACYLYSGQRQWWIDTENVPQLQKYN